MNNEELQSRREFFKKAGKRVLPLVGFVTLGPSFLAACSKDEEGEDNKDSQGSQDNQSLSQGNSGDSSTVSVDNEGESTESTTVVIPAGTSSNPFTVAAAVAYAKTLGTNVESSEPYFIKGIVDTIFESDNYNVSFLMTDENGEIFHVPNAFYTRTRGYGDQLETGDVVVVCGNIVYDGVTARTASACMIYSVNGDSFENHQCSDCTAVCMSNCNDTCLSTCTGYCTGTCENYCTGTCENYCTGTCENYCTGDCGSSCSGDCSSSCGDSCSSTCSGSCGSSCSSGCRTICTYNCKNSCGTTVSNSRM